ncbi:hypothetical protein [Cupriavidus basilensis]|uniref:hypothetical protein n=1 Tax=Cupriavidus basilensis TaxID=68895 RepID=UPI0020A6971C|nr:hypothetical protein [Cupriavidus basilensis]MCP3017578.1 hypothetical protein [Cupriavidus basilensis]MDR3383975.1 hypothetical protein [Cupriavidus basilensis]
MHQHWAGYQLPILVNAAKAGPDAGALLDQVGAQDEPLESAPQEFLVRLHARLLHRLAIAAEDVELHAIDPAVGIRHAAANGVA